eukprot:3041112-Prymnesium_polylepis.1
MDADLEAQQRFDGLAIRRHTSRVQVQRLLALLRNLQVTLRREHSYVADYIMAGELFRTEAMGDVQLVIDRGMHARRTPPPANTTLTPRARAMPFK